MLEGISDTYTTHDLLNHWRAYAGLNMIFSVEQRMRNFKREKQTGGLPQVNKKFKDAELGKRIMF